MLPTMTELPTWPAAERNKQPIAEVLTQLLPTAGLVLEIASATGQHAEHFAREFPHLRWQPTDYDPEHVTTLQQRVQRAALDNLLQPLPLDVTHDDWPVQRADAIYNANMIHISPWEVSVGLFVGAAKLLAAGAPLITYGPYAFDGEHTSESNARFDESLKQRDPRWGVRDVTELQRVAEEQGFELEQQFAMPANNFTLLWRKA